MDSARGVELAFYSNSESVDKKTRSREVHVCAVFRRKACSKAERQSCRNKITELDSCSTLRYLTLRMAVIGDAISAIQLDPVADSTVDCSLRHFERDGDVGAATSHVDKFRQLLQSATCKLHTNVKDAVVGQKLTKPAKLALRIHSPIGNLKHILRPARRALGDCHTW